MPYRDPEQKKQYDRARYKRERNIVRTQQLLRRIELVERRVADNAFRRGKRKAARQILAAMTKNGGVRWLFRNELDLIRRMAR